MSSTTSDAPPVCPFLEIPCELRYRIYELLFASYGNRSIHITVSPGPDFRRPYLLKSSLCQERSDCHTCEKLASDQAFMDSHMDAAASSSPSHLSGTTDTVRYAHRQAWIQLDTGRRQDKSTAHCAISRTCRQLYHEARTLPYSLSTFRFHRLHDLAVFARALESQGIEDFHSPSYVWLWNETYWLSDLDVALLRDRLAPLKELMLWMVFDADCDWRPQAGRAQRLLRKQFGGLVSVNRVRVAVVGDDFFLGNKPSDPPRSLREANAQADWDDAMARRRWADRLQKAMS